MTRSSTTVNPTCAHSASLQHKPDWPEAQQRWVAFWDRSATDRPCMVIKARQQSDLSPPLLPESLEDLYFDPDYISQAWQYRMGSTYFGGEAVPTGGFFMGGYALGCGDGAVFAPDTVWHPVTMSTIDDPFNWHPGPDDPWRQKLDRVLNRLLDLAQGKALVGYATQVMANDLLMLLRDTTPFLIDMAEDCGKCARRLEEIIPLWIENVEHFRSLVNARQGAGCVWGWPGLWHPEMVMISQSDMSCMISEEMFECYVVKELDMLADLYGPLWYHLDGPTAFHHVPMLLASPSVAVIQYVPGPGQPPNGPHWIDLYQQVQAAGMGLDLSAPLANMEYLIRSLSPEGLVLRTSTPNQEAADELLDSAVKWCGTHVGG